MASGRKVDRDTRRTIARLYADGIGTAEIAAQYRLSSQTVSRIARSETGFQGVRLPHTRTKRAAMVDNGSSMRLLEDADGPLTLTLGQVRAVLHEIITRDHMIERLISRLQARGAPSLNQQVDSLIAQVLVEEQRANTLQRELDVCRGRK